MRLHCLIRRRMSALLIMVSLLMLQASLMVISPHKLSQDLSPSRISSYVLVTASDGVAAVADHNNRLRNRFGAFLTLLALVKIIVHHVLTTCLARHKDTTALHLWDVLVGREQSAMPHADMVALK